MERRIFERMISWAARHPMSWLFVCLMLLVSLACASSVLDAWVRAAAYERVTGKKVSTWDAMFLRLRVEDEAK